MTTMDQRAPLGSTTRRRSAAAVLAVLAAASGPAVAANNVSVYTGPGGTSAAPATGTFSLATDFAGGAAPASGATTEVDLGGSGSAGYTATNDLGPLTMNEIQLFSTATAAETLVASNAANGLTLAANGTVLPTIIQNGTGAFNLSIGLALTGATTVGGSGTGALTFAGPITGASGLTLATPAPVAFTGLNTYTGTTNLSTGSAAYTAAGGSTGNGGLIVGGQTGTAVLTINTTGAVRFGGTVSVGGLTGTANSSGAGAVVQTNGVVNLSSGSAYLEIGTGVAATSPGSYGSYTLAGGSLTTSDTSGIRVGVAGTGVFTQTGGSLFVSRYFAIGNGAPRAVATFTGGTATVTPGYRFLVGDSATSNAVLNVGTEAGGTAVLTNQNGAGIVLSDNAGFTTGSATVNLNGGTINQSAGSITKASTSAAVPALLNLNGGTLQAGANNLTLVAANLTAATVYNGGLTVDTQANTATIAAPLLAATGTGLYATTGGRGVLAVANGGGGYIGAPAVTVAGGTGTGATAIANVVNGAITGVTITSPGQGYTVGDALSFTFNGGGSTTVAPTFAYTLAGADAAANGIGGLTKIGTGTLVLTGANTYAGATTITAGAVQLNSVSSTVAGTLGTGPVNVAAGASLNFNRTDGGLSVANAIAGAGAVQQIGTGTTLLTGVSTYTGATNVTAGRLSVGPTASLGNTAITAAGGTFNPQPGSGTLDIGSGSASLTLGAAGGFDLTDGAIGTVNLRNTAGATGLTLGAATGSAPTLTFELGQAATDRLNVTGLAAVGTSGASVVVSPLASDASVTPGNYTLITAGGGLGAGLTLASTNVSVNGTLYSLSLSNSTATSEVLSVRQISGALPQAYWTGTISNAWNATANGGTNFNTDDTSGVPTGTLPDPTTNVTFTAGTGGQNLNTVLGQDFTINSLTLDGQASGPVTIGGANTLAINALATNGNAAGNGITLQGGSTAVTISAKVGLNSAQTWTNNSANPLTVTGNISGGVALTQAGGGTLTLAGNNAFTGGLTTGGGQLNVNSGGALGTGTFTVANAVTLDNTSGAAVAVSTANPIAVNGDVTFNGTGNLNLGTGPVTLGGSRQLTLNAGTLTVGGTVTDNTNNYGITTTGPGALTLAGSLTGTLPLTFNGPGTVNLTGPASTVTGSVTVSGGVTNIAGAGGITGNVLQVGGLSGNAVLNVNTTGTVAFNVPDLGGVTGSGSTSTNAAGAINQTAGTVVYSTGSTAYLTLGAGGTSSTAGYGSYTISGGILTAGPTATTASAALTQAGIRVGAVGYGSFVQTGGQVVLGRYFAEGTLGTGVATITGGTMVGPIPFEYRIGDNNGTGTFNLGTQAGGNGTVVSQSTLAAGGFVVGSGATSTGVLNLNAGTLQELAGSITSRSATANGTVNLNGGTVQAGATGLTLIDNTFNQAQHAALVYNGGAVFDTAGNAAAVAANLQGTTGNGFYPAGGTLALPAGTGGAGYIGQPVVLVYGGSGTGATAVADVVNGAVAGVTLTSPGQGYQPGDTVTFAFDNFVTGGANGGATSTAADFNYTVAAVDPNLAANGTGGLTKVGAGTLTLSGADTYTGSTNVSAGTLAVATTASLPAAGNVTVAAGATFALATRNAGGASIVPTVGTLTLATTAGAYTGRVDVANGAIVVRGSTLATVTAEAAAGYAAGTFNGAGGIVSSATFADATRLTAVGVIANNDGNGNPLYGNGSATSALFNGASPNLNDVLVKYTYFGDATLDGKVDGADYARIDAGFLAKGALTGWYNGDFNYDGKVDASDYTLIDNASNLQAGQINPTVTPGPSADGLTASATDKIAAVGATAAVPEPASVGLLAVAAAGLLGRRRRV